jgi:hypothetical protein
MDITETAVREWVRRARADRTHGRTGLITAERRVGTRTRLALFAVKRMTETLQYVSSPRDLENSQQDES